jgi:AMME syndrome candidate gene 1 protein
LRLKHAFINLNIELNRLPKSFAHYLFLPVSVQLHSKSLLFAMATAAHCFYCFEYLSASFEGRDPPSLQKVEDLWEQYEASQTSPKNTEPGPAAGIKDADVVSGNLDMRDEDGVEEDEEGIEEEDLEDGEEPTSVSIHSPRPQHQSISRLQAPTPDSRSSNSSTPSVLSANSSQSVLTSASSASNTSTPPSYASRLSATESYPLFVTWNTLSRTSGDKRLRGCIGTFDALPLETGLQSYSLTSAFEDTRFSPIPSTLLSSLSCSLTLLANFEPCRDVMDWVLGRHGIRINFTSRGRRHGATYLPDVAVEQGWNKEETVESLMKKAGWDGGSSHGGGYARRILRGSKADEAKGKPWDEVTDFRTVRYTGLGASATYSEWQEWKSWIDRQPGVSLR